MIELYTWPAPNGDKIHLVLAGAGTPYNVLLIDVGAGDQVKPQFLGIA